MPWRKPIEQNRARYGVSVGSLDARLGSAVRNANAVTARPAESCKSDGMISMTIDDAVEWATHRAATAKRTLLGLTGCPGAGKSTLSGRIAHALGPQQCVIVPMDGFHLDNAVLEIHGTRNRKGAPQTFDVAGYASLLGRLRNQTPGELVYAPRYDRELSTSIAGAIEVSAEVPLVITEGNYLLLDDGPWASVRQTLDACWFVTVSDEIRVPRLIARHVAFGKTPAAAEEWVRRSDEVNAALVRVSASRADAWVAID